MTTGSSSLSQARDWGLLMVELGVPEGCEWPLGWGLKPLGESSKDRGWKYIWQRRGLLCGDT